MLVTKMHTVHSGRTHLMKCICPCTLDDIMYLKFIHTSSIVSAVKVVWTSSLYVGDKNAHGIVEEKHLGE
jgi:hypothetical protein